MGPPNLFAGQFKYDPSKMLKITQCPFLPPSDFILWRTADSSFEPGLWLSRNFALSVH